MEITNLLEWLQASSCPYPERLRDVTSRKTTTPAFPRTDISALKPWTGFADSVKLNRDRLKALPPPQLPLPGQSRPHCVNSEPSIVTVLHTKVFNPLEVVMNLLGHDVLLTDVGGNVEAVANPDFLLRTRSQPKPRIVGEVKTPWAFENVPDDLVTHWRKLKKGNSTFRRAIEQAYGYMAFNHVRYGVVTTFERTWFLRRSATTEGGVLDISPVFDVATPCDGITMLEAFTSFLLLVEEGQGEDTWLYVSPTLSPWPPRKEMKKRKRESEISRYDLSEFHPSLVDFQTGIGRDRTGSVIRGLYQRLPVVMKVVDSSKQLEQSDELRHEVNVYQALETLQGTVIPTFVAYGRLWGMLDILVMNYAGDAITSAPNRKTIKKINSCLEKLHQHQVLHGDPKITNFLRNGQDIVVCDFGLSRFDASPEELKAEKFEVEI